MQTLEKEAYENVFQRLDGDSEPKGLYEVFKNYEVSEKAEDKEAKMPKWVKVKPPQPSYHGSVRQWWKEKTMKSISSVTKKNSARLGRKWCIFGKDGKPVREIGASMIRRVQMKYKAHMNSLKIPTFLEASGNVNFEEATQGGQLQWRSIKEIERTK
ncbi:hypothetical protein ACFX11_014842 [Malus domestica]